MNSRTETLLKNYSPALAIIAYTSHAGSFDDCYLESHCIDEQGRLMEGKPLQQETIQGMVDVFFDERQNSSQLSGYFPEQLLNYEPLPGGNYSLMWWQPAQAKTMYFAPQLKIKSGQASMPPLMYHVKGRSLNVYALLSDLRPKLNAQLYRAPFHNVSDDGAVCLGNATVKKPEDRTFENMIKYWEDLFWRSEFSHLNGAANPTKTDLTTLWQQLIGLKKAKAFPLDELKKSKQTIKSLL